MNHVLAFSPRPDSAMYMLVDGDMDESWRKKFIKAGAVNGEERNEIMVTKHEKHNEDGFDSFHERSLEKLLLGTLQRELDVVSNSALLDDKGQDKARDDISYKYGQLAYNGEGALDLEKGE